MITVSFKCFACNGDIFQTTFLTVYVIEINPYDLKTGHIHLYHSYNTYNAKTGHIHLDHSYNTYICGSTRVQHIINFQRTQYFARSRWDHFRSQFWYDQRMQYFARSRWDHFRSQFWSDQVLTTQQLNSVRSWRRSIFRRRCEVFIQDITPVFKMLNHNRMQHFHSNSEFSMTMVKRDSLGALSTYLIRGTKSLIVHTLRMCKQQSSN